MSERRAKFYLACYLLLRKGGKVLLLRRANTGYHDGDYTMVSGHLDGSESVKEAMIRESKEEAGIRIDEKDLRVVHIVHRISTDREYTDFYLLCEKWDGTPTNTEPEKCSDLRWFDEKELPGNIIGYIPFVIKRIEKGEFFSEYNESISGHM